MKPSALRVLDLLRDHPEGVTAMDALAEGCGDSLAQRIHELRTEGHVIAWDWQTTSNGARVKRYRLAPPRFAPVTGTQEGLAL